MWQPSAVTGTAALVGSETVDLWKDYLRFHLIERYAAVLPKAVAAGDFAFYGKILSGMQQMPDHPGLHYNYACFATLAGDTSDETFDHLRRSVELLPRFRDDARRDDDFAAVRNDPRFQQALH